MFLSQTIGIWTPQLSLMLMQQWYKVETPDAQKNFNNPVGGFAFYNNFKLLFLGVLLEVDSWLITTGDDEANRNEEAAWSVHFNLRKDFLNDRLSLQLQGTDLFNSSSVLNTFLSSTVLCIV